MGLNLVRGILTIHTEPPGPDNRDSRDLFIPANRLSREWFTPASLLLIRGTVNRDSRDPFIPVNRLSREWFTQASLLHLIRGPGNRHSREWFTPANLLRLIHLNPVSGFRQVRFPPNHRPLTVILASPTYNSRTIQIIRLEVLPMLASRHSQDLLR